MWLTTIEGLDWPKTKAVSKGTQEKQQQELMWLLDSLERLHINTVLFQTRLRGDVLYPSKLEPFARVLTGREGGDPGYYPLAFAV